MVGSLLAQVSAFFFLFCFHSLAVSQLWLRCSVEFVHILLNLVCLELTSLIAKSLFENNELFTFVFTSFSFSAFGFIYTPPPLTACKNCNL